MIPPEWACHPNPIVKHYCDESITWEGGAQ